ncbi:hypothetical protein B0H11DRAFT_2240675 [Mycena galericulata]|nr:hypothetical protein B0H11DRAFT_2240675 [Mycena galericulata]
MSRYLDGDDARENPLSLQALQREGSDGGEHGSGAFDLMSQSWPHLTVSGTLDSVFGSKAEKKLLMQRYDNHLFRAIRLSVSQLRVTALRNHQSTMSEDEHDDVQHASQRSLRSRGANVSFTTSTSDTAPSAAKRKSALTVAAPAPKPKQRKAGDSLTGRPIELVPGDKTTAVSPREYAQKEPEEFGAQHPQYVNNPTKNTCPHWDPTNLTIPNSDPTKIEQVP